ncbi:thioredoxin family protein [Vampirovibrio sp.]|uniref:thioredoxin family protein n=1 Tax=Vampirovibrio sp. TaxID=2717857 RepID=UPI0035936720
MLTSLSGRMPLALPVEPPAKPPSKQRATAMFKRSFLMVLMIVSLVFASAFASQLWITRTLPSSHDPGLSIDQAFKTSKVPLLVEFYSDTCGTCQTLTPVIHELQAGPYKDRLTLVMLDVSEPSNQEIAKLFGVDALPGVFIFDHHHMKKYPIKPENFVSKGTLQQAIDAALSETMKQASGRSATSQKVALRLGQ